MKVYNGDLEIHNILSLKFDARPLPVATFLAYSEILPYILNDSQGRLHAEVDHLWEGKYPFTHLTDGAGNVVWSYK